MKDQVYSHLGNWDHQLFGQEQYVAQHVEGACMCYADELKGHV